jgi:hypothetical protein
LGLGWPIQKSRGPSKIEINAYRFADREVYFFWPNAIDGEACYVRVTSGNVYCSLKGLFPNPINAESEWLKQPDDAFGSRATVKKLMATQTSDELAKLAKEMFEKVWIHQPLDLTATA